MAQDTFVRAARPELTLGPGLKSGPGLKFGNDTASAFPAGSLTIGEFNSALGDLLGNIDPEAEALLPLFLEKMGDFQDDRTLKAAKVAAAGEQFTRGVANIMENNGASRPLAAAVALTCKYFYNDALEPQEVEGFLVFSHRLLEGLNKAKFQAWIGKNEIEQKIPLTAADPLEKLMALLAEESQKASAPKKSKKKKAAAPDDESAIGILTRLTTKHAAQIGEILNWERFHKLVVESEADPKALRQTAQTLERLLENRAQDYGLKYLFDQLMSIRPEPDWRLAATEIIAAIYNEGGNPHFFGQLFLQTNDIKTLSTERLNAHFKALPALIHEKHTRSDRNQLQTLATKLVANRFLAVQTDLSFTEGLKGALALNDILKPHFPDKSLDYTLEYFKTARKPEQVQTLIDTLKGHFQTFQENPHALQRIIPVIFQYGIDIGATVATNIATYEAIGGKAFDRMAAWSDGFKHTDTFTQLAAILTTDPLKECMALAEPVATDKSALVTILTLAKKFSDNQADPLPLIWMYAQKMTRNKSAIHDLSASRYGGLESLIPAIKPFTTPEDKEILKRTVLDIWHYVDGQEVNYANYGQWITLGHAITKALPTDIPLALRSRMMTAILSQKGLVSDPAPLIAELKRFIQSLQGGPPENKNQLLELWCKSAAALTPVPYLVQPFLQAKPGNLTPEALEKLFKTFGAIATKTTQNDTNRQWVTQVFNALLAKLVSLEASNTAGIDKAITHISTTFDNLIGLYNSDEALKRLPSEMTRPSISSTMLRQIKDKFDTYYSYNNQEDALKILKDYAAIGQDPEPLVEFLCTPVSGYTAPYALKDNFTKAFQPFYKLDQYKTKKEQDALLPVLKALYLNSSGNSGYTFANWPTVFEQLLKLYLSLPDALSKEKKQGFLEKVVKHIPGAEVAEPFKTQVSRLYQSLGNQDNVIHAVTDHLLANPARIRQCGLLTTALQILNPQGQPNPQTIAQQLEGLSPVLNELQALPLSVQTPEQLGQLLQYPLPKIQTILATYRTLKESYRTPETIFTEQTPLQPHLMLLEALTHPEKEIPDALLDQYMLNFDKLHPTFVLHLMFYLAHHREGSVIGKKLLPEILSMLGPFTTSLAGKNLDNGQYSAEAMKVLGALSNITLSNIEPAEYDNYARIGVLGLSFPKWKFDAMTRWKGQGQAEKSALLETSGQFNKVAKREDDPKFHGGFHRYDPKTGVSLELRRGYMVISKPGLGTLVIRNSGTQFGRDLLDQVAYYHPTRIYTSGEDLFFPEQDLTADYLGATFKPVLSNDYQERSRKATVHNNIKALLDEFDKGMVPYLEWKYGFKQGKPAQGIQELVNASLLSFRNQGVETPFGTIQNIQLAWVNRFGVPYPVDTFDLADPQNLAEVEYFDRVLNKEDRALRPEEYQEKMPNLMRFLTYGLEHKLELMLSA